MEVQDLGTMATGTTPPSGDAPAAPAGESQPTAQARPEWLPEDYFDAEKGIKLDEFGKHYGELTASAKAEADRIAAYPQKIEDLKFQLPADLKLPEGVSFDEKNPQYQAFRQFVFDKKLDPALGSEMLGMYAREKVAEADLINNRVKEELQKLGPQHAGRIESLRTFLDAQVGKDQSKALMAGLFTAPQVEAMEKLMLAMTNQGAQPVPGGNREAPPAGISDEEYEAMTPRQRLDYARSKQKSA